MPSGIIPDEDGGMALMLWWQLAFPGLTDWYLFFWVNDIVPDHATVFADLQEASWDGYGRRLLNRAKWTGPVVSAGCFTITYDTAPMSWNVNGGPFETLFGWGAVDSLSGVIRFVQRFDDADIRAVVAGTPVQLQPVITSTSAACAG